MDQTNLRGNEQQLNEEFAPTEETLVADSFVDFEGEIEPSSYKIYWFWGSVEEANEGQLLGKWWADSN